MWERLKPVAREFRHKPTEAEAKLWQALRRNQVAGYHFRRQHATDRFIVDFYCSKAKLVIEVDGPIHQKTTAEDKAREELLSSAGVRILRFRNEQVLNELDQIIQEITAALAPSDPTETSPSPQAERGTEEERS